MLLALLFFPFFALPATALPVRLLLGLHIAAGTAALLIGLVPMLSRTGGGAHVRAGRLYTVCMVAVAATAGGLCVLQPLTLGRLFLTGIALLSFYLSFSGWRAARRRSVQLPTSDIVLAGIAVAVGLGMVAAGVWLGAVLFAFFGALICVFAGLDTWHGVRRAGPATGPAAWVLRHVTRMGGSYISAATAFIVVNLGRWLPAGAPSWAGLAGWLAPTFIGSFVILRAVRRYRARLQPRPDAAHPAKAARPLAGLALLLALAAPAVAQVPGRLTGTITDEAGRPLPYATVGVTGKGVGTVADEQGRFQLALPAAQVTASDTLRFALLGYAAQSRVAGSLPAGQLLTVVLPEAAISLPNVRVQARGLDSVRIGNRHYRTNLQTNFALGKQPGLNVGSEIGRVFQLPTRGAWLDTFEFVLSANDFDTIQLRINIYKLQGGTPAGLLLRYPIYKQLTRLGATRIRIDLRPEHLFVEENEIAITVEWIGHSRRGSQLALPLLMPAFATHLYRYGAANRWKKFTGMSTTMELLVLE
ncbi:hypothetical protein GCM10022408_02200 [Hymenobacter fastidiosus]|uniref:Carboxypeptidase-like regulatory domain-containing protein n=1 Tax=Hymenobacter fastidiosus TaxID=486264 RepID=A0ABP7RC39_9BACT